jgi:hypothetical protein
MDVNLGDLIARMEADPSVRVLQYMLTEENIPDALEALARTKYARDDDLNALKVIVLRLLKEIQAKGGWAT